MNINDFIDQFVDDIDFDALKNWCEIFSIGYEPRLDDNWPDWEDDIRLAIGEAMKKVGK